MKKQTNKWSIIIGFILAGLNLIFPGYSAILCILDTTKDFCGEAWAGVVINTPMFQILAWPFVGEELSRSFFIILLLSGLIQYFLVGYLLSKLVILITKKAKRLF